MWRIYVEGESTLSEFQSLKELMEHYVSIRACGGIGPKRRVEVWHKARTQWRLVDGWVID